MTAIIAISVFFLLIAVASRNTTPREESTSFPTQPTQINIQPWEKDHFIQKHIHRDDKKHDRHKKNQTPW